MPTTSYYKTVNKLKLTETIYTILTLYIIGQQIRCTFRHIRPTVTEYNMDQLRPPFKLDFDSPNLATRWKHWREEFTLYAELAMADKSEEIQAKLCLYLLDIKGREIYETIRPKPQTETKRVKEIIDVFDSYCNPKKNETVERYKFFTRVQENSESIESYITELKILSTTCSFDTLQDSLIRDRIICGIVDSALRERLLREAVLNLTRCEELCRASVLSRERIRTIEQQQDVHAIRQRPSDHRKYKSNPKNKKSSKFSYTECQYCGTKHKWGKDRCPAYGHTCNICQKDNHLENMCWSRPENVSKYKHRPKDKRCNKVDICNVETGSINVTEYESYDSSDYDDINYVKLIEEHKVDTVNNKSNKHVGQIYAIMSIDNKMINFQIDSGATCNIMSKSLLDTLGSYSIESTNQVLAMYNGSTTKPRGQCTLKMINPKNQRKYKAQFIIIDSEFAAPLLGNTSIQKMNLIEVKQENIASQSDIGCKTVLHSNSNVHVNSVDNCTTETLTEKQLLAEYGDVFTGDGLLKGDYHLDIEPNSKPIIHPPRRVPVAIRNELKSELDRLTESNIIIPVTTPTPWVSSLVTVVKPGKLRICLDPKDLNKCLRRSHYPMPILEDILPDISQARVFSVFDAKHGFWHIPLDRDSSFLTTFNTPFGRYRWLRLPFGLNTAPEVFQRRQHQALEGLSGVQCIVDDILVYGEGRTDIEARLDHDKKVLALMERCRKVNLKLNKDKIKLAKTEVSYIGHLITNNGLKPDPAKVEAVKNMPKPTDVAGVQRFIGFVNYLSKFLPGLSDACEPLRKLTLKEAVWCWNYHHDIAFDNIKHLVTSHPVLRYYDNTKELTLQCDASETGLGAALMQEGQPIAYASRALTDVETRYAQIEKELLSVIFGLERFHQYTYGRHVTIQSDHKPLEIIQKKPLYKAPKRLQRMLLKMQLYDVTIVYRSGKSMQLADTLSRAYLSAKYENICSNDTEIVNMIKQLPISEPRTLEIRQHTDCDQTLQQLKEIILTGWPLIKDDVPLDILPYFHCRDELTVEDGIIIRGERAVIPKTLRKDMISRVHSSHLGIEACLRRARECIYWPNMNTEIKDFMQTCDTCRSMERKQTKEPLHSHEPENRPWSKVGVDLFYLDGRDYLVTVDYFSGFWEIDYLPDTLSKTVINKLKGHFARNGIPDICMTDNGPQFSSHDYKKFANTYKFSHVTSSPGYPQSNGRVENAVKMAKSIITKAKKANTDPYLGLLAYRNTPTQHLNSSPAQRLFSRRTKTLLPTTHTLLTPRVESGVTIKQAQSKAKQSFYYNRSAHTLPVLAKNDVVRIMPTRPREEWRRARVTKDLGNRSYEVETEDHRTFRRNRKHLKGTKEQILNETYVENDMQLVATPKHVADDMNVQSDVIVEPVVQPTQSSEVGHTPHNTPPSIMTRAGRQTRVPRYLKDYVT